MSVPAEEPAHEPTAELTDEAAEEPADWPSMYLGAGADESDGDGPHRPAHLRAILIVAGVVVVVGLVVGILVFNSSAPPLGRGAESASLAAGTFVAAVNNGDESAAADIACDQFADQARAAARTGSDPGISFALGRMVMRSKTAASVSVQERIQLPGGHSHTQPITLSVQRSGGRWLICGRSG